MTSPQNTDLNAKINAVHTAVDALTNSANSFPDNQANYDVSDSIQQLRDAQNALNAVVSKFQSFARN